MFELLVPNQNLLTLATMLIRGLFRPIRKNPWSSNKPPDYKQDPWPFGAVITSYPKSPAMINCLRSHQNCRKRQKSPPCEATTWMSSIRFLGFISTWATRHENLCTVQQPRQESSELESIMSYQLLYARSKQGYPQTLYANWCSSIQEGYTEAIVCFRSGFNDMVMELSKGSQKDFQWVPSAYWIFLSSFYFQQKHAPASGHDQAPYADSRLHCQHTQPTRWLCGVRGGTNGLPAGTTKRLLVKWLT